MQPWREKSLVPVASEVQGKTTTSCSQVTSGWLLRLNASSVKWGICSWPERSLEASLTCESAEQGRRANQVYFPSAPVLSPSSATPFSELWAPGFGSSCTDFGTVAL